MEQVWKNNGCHQFRQSHTKQTDTYLMQAKEIFQTIPKLAQSC